MNRGHKILEEGKEVRRSRERLEALREPWYYLLAPHAVAVGIIVYLLNGDLRRVAFELGTFEAHAALLLVVAFSLARSWQQRERLWREFVAKGAPELYSQLEAPDPVADPAAPR